MTRAAIVAIASLSIRSNFCRDSLKVVPTAPRTDVAEGNSGSR